MNEFTRLIHRVSWKNVMSEVGVQKQIEVYRRMSGQQRLQVGLELYDLAQALVRSGVHYDHPTWDEKQIQEEVKRRFRLAAGIPQRSD